jgi:hypothetical protein
MMANGLCKYYGAMTSDQAVRCCNWQISSRRGQRLKGESLMRTLLSALAMIVIGGFCSQANAQAQCPELTRLRSEAAEAQKPMARGLISNRCDTYIRTSMAWRAVLQYAEDNREMCGISIRSLGEFEKYYSEAASARDNVCTGRPARPFPAEIIQR